MAQRRPITTHPAFVPLLALWFAALLGLAVAVLPTAILQNGLAASGMSALVPLTVAGRMIASVGAALVGALLGLAFAVLIARRGRSDPRPTYDEPEVAAEQRVYEETVRRPLRVREELADELPDEYRQGAISDEAASEGGFAVGGRPAAPSLAPVIAEGEEGFMILSPQPVHPPQPAPDLDSLLQQFDTVLAAFRSGDEDRPVGSSDSPPAGPDPVHAFVARQTGSPAPGHSPLGGVMPDHQAELRAALDKLARAHRKD